MKKTAMLGFLAVLMCTFIFFIGFLLPKTEKESLDVSVAENCDEKVTVKQEIWEEDDFYCIFANEDFTYDYYIKDKNGKELLSVKGDPKCPSINRVSDDVLSLGIQTGTGKATAIVRYFNTETGEVSTPFSYVLGEVENKVIYVDFDANRGYSVVMCNIFDVTDIDCIATLEDVHTVEPIVEYVISNEQIYIVYLKGKDYVETEIRITPEKTPGVSESFGQTKNIAQGIAKDLFEISQRESFTAHGQHLLQGGQRPLQNHLFRQSVSDFPVYPVRGIGHLPKRRSDHRGVLPPPDNGS